MPMPPRPGGVETAAMVSMIASESCQAQACAGNSVEAARPVALDSERRMVGQRLSDPSARL